MRGKRQTITTRVFWEMLAGLVCGGLCGVSSAVFLWVLERAIALRVGHFWLLWLLPAAGLATAWAYGRAGSDVSEGTARVLFAARVRGVGLPGTMSPMVLIFTWLAHLCGASVGREGTAVQMGGALAQTAAKALRAPRRFRKDWVLAGVSGGFGAVFGTPLAGFVFALEVCRAADFRTTRTLRRVPFLSVALSAWVGDFVARSLGTAHATFPSEFALPGGAGFWLAVIAVGIGSGLVARSFVMATAWVKRACGRLLALARPVVGGLVVVALAGFFGDGPLNLSLPWLRKSFSPDSVAPWAFAGKLLFTAICVGSGFKGGEVTPLFVIGATFGATAANVAGFPAPVFAACGLCAMFAGASRATLACIALGVELFGFGPILPVAAACVLARSLMGKSGIYDH